MFLRKISTWYKSVQKSQQLSQGAAVVLLSSGIIYPGLSPDSLEGVEHKRFLFF
jgi:hypothetical protein